MAPSSKYEELAFASGARMVAGIDEAGRGPLAGPVVAGAVILNGFSDVPGLDDSKLLTEKKRNTLFKLILSRARSVGVGVVSPEEIDRINIFQATRMAMKIAASRLDVTPDYLLIDGPIKIDVVCAQQSIIKGDRHSLSIAAASIVAKVSRDRIMWELDKEFPNYGFAKHKGYATREHQLAIKRHGPCPAHRTSFRLGPEPVQSNMFQSG